MTSGELNIDSSVTEKSGKQIFFDVINNSGSQQTDKELWNAFKNGSLTAYKLIYEQNVDSLYEYGTTIAPDSNIITDCIQDMFVHLWNRRSKLGKVNNIKGYLFIAYRRRLLDSIKKQKKKLNIEDLNGLEIFMEENSNTDLAIERKASIISALNALPSQKKEAIYLRFFNDLSCAEISEIMRIKTQSVYNLISSGLKVIRDNIMLLLYLLIYCHLV